MISLKKHMDEAPDLLKSVTSAYQSALAGMARAAGRAAPQIAPALQKNLEALGGKLSLKTVAEIDRRVVTELDDWGERSSNYFRQKAAEVREILLFVTQTARAAGEKDEQYASQLCAFSGRLKDIASLDDLTGIRRSLHESAADLNACVERMAEDGRAIVSKLRSEVAVYQARLHEAEKQASIDALTGLDNRRGIERRIEERVEQNRVFTLILFDLNHFKQINDTHGHLAGDEILTQFSAELRSRFRPGDDAGRWGGDEFLVVFNGSSDQAQTAVRKASEWLFGDYRINSVKLQVTASYGIAQWDGKEEFADTVRRADESMYKQKHERLTA